MRHHFKNYMRGSLGGAASIIALATASVAVAQDTADDDEDVVVVTGSRIAQDSTLTSASPVLAIGADDIKTSGQIDVTALLRESPALQASLPGSFSAFNGGALGASQLNLRNLGTERTLVLENGRRHVAGIEGSGIVDVNTMSTALLGSVEVLTGGASSVYGADAVTGVVNFIMRDGSSFDGMEVRAQAGISDDGDAEEYFVSVANGFETADGRGSIVYAVEYQHQESLESGDRDFAGSGLRTLVPNGAAAQAAFGVDPRFDNTYVPDYTLPISSDIGIIALSPFESAFVEAVISGGQLGCDTIGTAAIPTCQVFDNGTLRPYNPGDVFIDGFNASGGDGVPGDPDDELLFPETDRVLFQTAGKYQVNDYVEFFADAKYVFTQTTESNQVNGFNDDIPIAADNPFIPAELQAQLDTLAAEGITPNIVMSRDTLDASTRANPVAERKTFRIVGGITGQLPRLGFDYELSYNFGRTDADITSNARIEDRFFAGIDAVVDPATGEVVCRSDIDSTATVPPSSPFPAQNGTFNISTFSPGDGQCVPINLFGANTISQEAADFAFLPTTSKNEIEQRDLLITVSGDTEEFFSLPAGPIGFALGYEYRREKSRFTADGLTQAGLTFGTIDSNGGPVSSSFGEYGVSEFFVEGRVPLAKDLPGIHLLEFEGSGRWSNYDAFDSTDTWTVGGRWAPVETLTIRTTVSQAVRVPNIGEAFSPTFTAFLGADDDPCNPQFIDAGTEFRRANCIAFVGSAVGDDPGAYNSTNFVSARIPGSSGGNPDLEPEEADTFTVGGVWRPAGEFNGLFDGLIVTADYYNIEIDGLIDSLSAFDIAQNCVDSASINNQFCDAIDRDPSTGVITDFRSGLINLGSVETSGVDWRVDYSFDVPPIMGRTNLGSLRLTSNGTRFLKNEEVRDPLAPEVVTDVLTTLTRPKWISNFSADWTYGDWVFGWRGRYESAQLPIGVEVDDLESNPDFVDVQTTGDAFVNDFSVSYYLDDRWELYGGINNAFETEPYIGSLSRPAGPRGRFFFIGVNAEF